MKKSKLKLSREDKIYYAVCYTIIILLSLIVLYPMIYVVSASVSSGTALMAGEVWLFPKDITFLGYKTILQYKNVWIGYRNTIFYTVIGTFINVVMTLLCAYPLTRNNLMGRKQIMMLFTFTMLFSGGMIPNYILMKKLHLLNTVWVMIIPGALSVYNMIVTKTFIQSSIPEELLEASKIDGCDDIRYFFTILLPLSKAVIAVISLWYAVGHWNAYFNAFLYLTDKELYPLQIFLKEILIQSKVNSELMDPEVALAMQNLQLILKYGMIVISTLPIFCLYPFAQKYFVKGVMIGSVKG
ncbi:MAG: carbohydrate ABC transporter permease [Agathobacter sp.]|nr:carbohydrate ABC transporter permease [Lachnospiraceae bacterium]MBR3812144.1 carbohydrate ABC transporter permease [Agathobacter sp.]MBR4060243.1 carbohydrate ABC transporter permease [Lachnospiraceae bacterium]